jgi:hypothetical protein
LTFSPDGKRLACSTADGKLQVWDLAAGQKVRTFDGAGGRISSAAFSPDGRHLAAAYGNTTVLVWDVTGLEGKTLAETLTEKELATLWRDLADEDAGKAYAAIWRLTSAPQSALPFLRQHLKPAARPDGRQLAALFNNLDHDDFAVRERASADLKKLGDVILPALRERLADKPSLEARRRLEEILTDIERLPPTPEALRSLRALEVLEHSGTSEARNLLEALAKGVKDCRFTDDAAAAVERMRKRS